jgi:hypothetical protein
MDPVEIRIDSEYGFIRKQLVYELQSPHIWAQILRPLTGVEASSEVGLKVNSGMGLPKLHKVHKVSFVHRTSLHISRTLPFPFGCYFFE